VTHFGGRRIGNSSDLRYAVGLVRPDTVAQLTYIRDGLTSEIDVIIREKGYFKTVEADSAFERLPMN